MEATFRVILSKLLTQPHQCVARQWWLQPDIQVQFQTTYAKVKQERKDKANEEMYSDIVKSLEWAKSLQITPPAIAVDDDEWDKRRRNLFYTNFHTKFV